MFSVSRFTEITDTEEKKIYSARIPAAIMSFNSPQALVLLISQDFLK